MDGNNQYQPFQKHAKRFDMSLKVCHMRGCDAETLTKLSDRGLVQWLTPVISTPWEPNVSGPPEVAGWLENSGLEGCCDKEPKFSISRIYTFLALPAAIIQAHTTIALAVTVPTESSQLAVPLLPP
ncbi:hypothetical protein AAY473_006680 [Plecturocebus cupreus]